MRMRSTLHNQLIHGLKIHSSDGSSDKLQKTMPLKLSKYTIFTLKEKVFPGQIFACVLFQMQTQSNFNRQSFK